MNVISFSRGVFILVNIKTGSLYLWFGSQSTVSQRQNGQRIASELAERCPMEVGLSLESSVYVTEAQEGTEPHEFMAALRSNNRTRYDCLKDRTSASTSICYLMVPLHWPAIVRIGCFFQDHHVTRLTCLASSKCPVLTWCSMSKRCCMRQGMSPTRRSHLCR